MTTTLRSLSQPPERAVQGTKFLELKARFRIQMVVLRGTGNISVQNPFDEGVWIIVNQWPCAGMLGKTADGFKSVCTLWIQS